LARYIKDFLGIRRCSTSAAFLAGRTELRHGQWMIRTLSLLLSGSLALSAAAIRGAESHDVLDVWPGPAPGETVAVGPETGKAIEPGNLMANGVTNVSHPTLTVFRPAKDHDTGVAMIVCPGGGYRELEMEKEGVEPARWLNTLGVSAFVLKYRVPKRENFPDYLPPLQDAQRAVSLVRSNAAAWGLKSDRIGMIGFSAGANLSVVASTQFDQRSYAAIDRIETVSCRPDFAVVVYPGSLMDKDTGALAAHIHVSGQTPQMFIVDAETDRVNSENSVVLFVALKRAGVPAELHMYAAGVHGFGVRPSANPHGTWTQRCSDWMIGQGILAR
jgi:acetyl esterase/lipase